MRQAVFCIVFTALPALSMAQNATFSTEFPASAQTFSQEEATKAFSGKSFNFTAADGFNLRVQLKDNGYCFINTSARQSTSGTWAVKESKLCTKLKGDPQESCSDVRVMQIERYSNATQMVRLLSLSLRPSGSTQRAKKERPRRSFFLQ